MPLPDKSNKEWAEDQEKSISEKSDDARKIKGSGSGPQKGDVDYSDFRIEAKTTKHKSFRLQKKQIKKAKIDSMKSGKEFAMSIEIRGIDSSALPNRFVLIEEDKFFEMTGKQEDD